MAPTSTSATSSAPETRTTGRRRRRGCPAEGPDRPASIAPGTVAVAGPPRVASRARIANSSCWRAGPGSSPSS